MSTFSNEGECLEKLKEIGQSLSLLSQNSSQLLPCLVKPALLSLKALYLDLNSALQLNTETIEAVLNYCTKIPQWPLESLICVADVLSNVSQ